jgi:hypothetical protein
MLSVTYNYKKNLVTYLFGHGNVVGSVRVLTVIRRNIHRESSYKAFIKTLHNIFTSLINDVNISKLILPVVSP